MPANLFFSTGIPVCILVLKKCKKPDDVLFINAAEYFEKGKRQNRLLPEHIKKIVDTYRHRTKEEHSSLHAQTHLHRFDGQPDALRRRPERRAHERSPHRAVSHPAGGRAENSSRQPRGLWTDRLGREAAAPGTMAKGTRVSGPLAPLSPDGCAKRRCQ